MSAITEKTAQSLFTNFTNNYVHILYPDADFSDLDLKKKLQFVMQNRTVMFLAYTLGGNYKDFLNFSTLSVDMSNKVIEALTAANCAPENIRMWWYDSGKCWAFKHRNIIKQQEKDASVAWVIHNDIENKFVNLTSSGYDLVKTPLEAQAFDVNIPGITEETLQHIAELTTNSLVRVFKMHRNALSPENIKTTGVKLKCLS